MSSDSVVRGLRHQLVDRLRSDVLSGYYAEGQPIRQDEVVARYNVSRTPVREALIQLAEEGLVTTTPNRGARVAKQAPDSIREFLIPIRRIIEVYALKLSFSRLSDEQFARFDAILQKMREACEANDYAGVAEQDIAFHRSIIEMADEPSLLKIWTTLVGQVRMHFQQSHRAYDDLMDVYREHAAIVETFRGGDVEESASYFAQRIGDTDASAMFEDLLISKKSKGRTRRKKS
ncbi:GntR family transcriptional regulator [Aeoliella sp.]|uniref:GntR family transcriptional regulator n=1 Tax=Aeoliella sp. TaxID=2795800 RepID=UPI003CCB8C12